MLVPASICRRMNMPFKIPSSGACCLFVLPVGMLLLNTEEAKAALSDGALDALVSQYTSNSLLVTWENASFNLSKYLFFLLATIEFCWAMCLLVFRRGDLSEWGATLVNQVIIIGIFFYLFSSGGSILQAILDSFTYASDTPISGGGLGGGSLSPTRIIAFGLYIAQTMFAQVDPSVPTNAALMMGGALVVVVCFGILSGYVATAIIQTYVVVGLGSIFLAFGGGRWSRGFATKTLAYTMAVGGKYMTLRVIVGLAMSTVTGWTTDFTAQISDDTPLTSRDVSLMVTCVIALTIVVVSIPGMIHRMVNGASVRLVGALSGSDPLIVGYDAERATQSAWTGIGSGIDTGVAERLRDLPATLLTGNVGSIVVTGSEGIPHTYLGGRLAGSRRDLLNGGRQITDSADFS